MATTAGTAALREQLMGLLQAAPRPLSTPELAIQLRHQESQKRWRAKDLRPHLLALEEAGQVLRWRTERAVFWVYGPHLDGATP